MKHPVDIEEICRIGVEENLKRIKVNDIIRVIDPDYFQCFACNRWKHRDDLTTNRISKNSKTKISRS